MQAKSDIRLQAVVLGAGTALMAIKFTAWGLTHSKAILSDALESIVNVVAGAFALYSLMLAAMLLAPVAFATLNQAAQMVA